MIKILKKNKSTWIYILFISLFVVIQVKADLFLPTYTAQIVNIGIQQKGIKDVAPDAMTRKNMDNTLEFSTQKNEILDRYILVNSGANSIENYENYLKKYPILETTDIYVKKDLDEEENKYLNSIMTKPIIINYILSSSQYSAQIRLDLLGMLSNEKKELLKRKSNVELIKNLTNEQRNEVVEKIDKLYGKYQGNISEQLAVKIVEEEYKTLGIDLKQYQLKYLLDIGGKMVVVALLSMICAISVMLLAAKLASQICRQLRKEIFSKVLSFSSKEIEEYTISSLITRSTNDIVQVQQMLSLMFRVVIYAPLIMIGGIIKIWQYSRSTMIYIIVFALVLLACLIILLFIVAYPIFKKLQKYIDKINGTAREMIAGIQTIRAFNKEENEESKFDIDNKNYMKASIFVNKTMSLIIPLSLLIFNGIILLIVWVGGNRANEGIMQIGDIMTFIQYTTQISLSILLMAVLSVIWPRAQVSIKRINEILDTKNILKNHKICKEDNNQRGNIEFKNVSFKYYDSEKYVLEGINFSAHRGTTTAIIGYNGEGKSTLINLIPRFFDATEGEVLVNGVNVKEQNVEHLRKKIGYVSQKSILFSGTIESNIKYSNPDISDMDMKKAADIAQISDFIEKQEKKYLTNVSQGGENFSEGQKQRIAIARAIANNPDIVIIDDATAPLDPQTEKKLYLSLRENFPEKTLIIISQKINVIKNSDQIILLNNGKICGQGKHDELMKNNKIYKELFNSQAENKS